MRIRTMTKADAEAVLAIYAEGVARGDATFECRTPDWAGFDAARLSSPRLVVEDADGVCGWAVLSAISSRSVYAGVAEVTVYIAQRVQGHGYGSRLLRALIEASEAAGVWMLQATVFPENNASIRLHESAGFRHVGRRERIAFMGCGPHAGRWRDTLLLERRSAVAG